MRITREFNRVRPSLASVSPLTVSICWGYAVGNLLIGTGLALVTNTKAPILIVGGYFTYQVWGALFVIVGLAQILFLVNNNWFWTRQILIAGVFVKSIWMIALLQRIFVDPGTALIAVVWLLLGFIQAMTYIFFTPPVFYSQEPPSVHT